MYRFNGQGNISDIFLELESDWLSISEYFSCKI